MPTVIGAIRDKWIQLGGATSFLGEPVTDESTPPDGVGRFNHFQGGNITWTQAGGAILSPGITLRAVEEGGDSSRLWVSGSRPARP
jgi:uncharacterized protein with LGFP repeats